MAEVREKNVKDHSKTVKKSSLPKNENNNIGETETNIISNKLNNNLILLKISCLSKL